jgi:hypothetical protein
MLFCVLLFFLYYCSYTFCGEQFDLYYNIYVKYIAQQKKKLLIIIAPLMKTTTQACLLYVIYREIMNL